MAGKVLGGRVEDEVCSQGDGLLVDGRRKGAVDANNGPVSVTQGRDTLDVYATKAGVRRRFAEEQGDLQDAGTPGVEKERHTRGRERKAHAQDRTRSLTCERTGGRVRKVDTQE